MAIQGLIEANQTPEAGMYRIGELDAKEEALVAVSVLNELGIIGDYDQTLESTTNDFYALADLGYDGRLIVKPTSEQASFDELLKAAESMRPKDVEELWRYPNLWAPGTEAESYSEDDLNQTPNKLAVARLVLFNTDETTGVDPILQHLDVPFDDYAKEQWGGESTQIEEVAKDKEAFEAMHPEHDLAGIDHRDFAFMALMDRIKGVDASEMILNKGFMRMQKLDRRGVGGNSIVGCVRSDDGQLKLGRGFGDAFPHDGVGLSVGLNEVA